MNRPRPHARLRTKSRKSAKPSCWYQVKILLEGTEPAVWRRIAVRGDVRLDLLHAVLQIAMGWTNSHLHQFLIGADQYSDPSFLEDLEGGEDKDERKLTLSQVVAGGIRTFGYEYDFGDSWSHLLVVEEELPADADDTLVARCVDGAAACPPEDCGGLGGFEDLLKAMKNPRSRHYRTMVEWLGGPFDPVAFDVKETSRFLTMLKWPRTSIMYLAGILGSQQISQRVQARRRLGK